MKLIFLLTNIYCIPQNGRDQYQDYKNTVEARKRTLDVETNGQTLLTHAIYDQNKWQVKLLLKNGARANHNIINAGRKESPLGIAAKVNNTEIVDLLMANGANPAMSSDDPINYALINNNQQMIQQFIHTHDLRSVSIAIAMENLHALTQMDITNRALATAIDKCNKALEHVHNNVCLAPKEKKQYFAYALERDCWEYVTLAMRTLPKERLLMLFNSAFE